MLKKHFLIGLCCIALFFPAFLSTCSAAITVGHTFSNHMVLQRDMNVPVWGTATPGEKVTVTFNGQTKTIVTPENGKWMVKLSPMKAAGPLTMTIQGSNTLTFTDAYVGEVWQCAGQSNMDTRMNFYPGYKDTIVNTNIPLLRFMVTRKGPDDWTIMTPETAGLCSATGYFFGKEIQKTLGCAVGLVVTAVGGTYLERWYDPSTIATNKDLPVAKKLIMGDMYDQFVAPIIPFAMRGTIWFQGEQNTTDSISAPTYGDRFKKLIKGWRAVWGQGDFPFYFAQLTTDRNGEAPDFKSRIVMVREGQRQATSLPNTAMTVNYDLSGGGWHFAKKYEAGQRLALIPKALLYGQKNTEYLGPVYQSMKVKGNVVRLTFAHIGSGLITKDGSAPIGFFIAGKDGVWYPVTTSSIEGKEVVLSSSNVVAPEKVCYGYGDKPKFNLYNKEGLTASPFCTDTPVPVMYKK